MFISKNKKATEPQPEVKRPSEDTSTRFALDTLLRLHGFIIHRRTKNHKAVWIRQGNRYSQEEAEHSIPKEELRLARMRQSGYHHRA